MSNEEKPAVVVPRIVSAVGISINATVSGNWNIADKIERAMAAAVQKAYDEGRGDDIPYIREVMAEARAQVERWAGYELGDVGAERRPSFSTPDD
jgi:hypothetical protein